MAKAAKPPKESSWSLRRRISPLLNPILIGQGSSSDSGGRSSRSGAVTPRAKGKTAFRRVAMQFEKHRARLKEEIQGWRQRLQPSQKGRPTPVLVSLEPMVPRTTESQEPGDVEYRATMSLLMPDGEHTWQTEPFTLDELLQVVVDARRARAQRWYSPRSEGAHRARGGWKAACRLISCFVRSVGFWAFIIWAAWKLTVILQPMVRGALDLVYLFSGIRLPGDTGVAGVLDFLATLALVISQMACWAVLLAGLSQMSFLPAKAILQLARKDETEQVKKQLEMLLCSGDCLRNLDVCNFLNLGMATY